MSTKQWSTAPAEAKLSPLDQIRYTEAEITRQIAAARESAEKTVAQERVQATRLKQEAQEAGQRDGQSHYLELIADAEGEARVLVAQAHRQADDLRRRGHRQTGKAVRKAIKIVLGEVDEPGEVIPKRGEQ